MNIFFLDKNPKIAAKMHCDKHVVKMILESAQLLSTAHRVLDGEDISYKLKDKKMEAKLYKAGWKFHPCAIWVRENSKNYMWLYKLFIALGEEFSIRYQKVHKSNAKLNSLLCNLPKNIKISDALIDPPQAMPEDCKVYNDVVAAYRKYYMLYKNHIATWKKPAKKPKWFYIPDSVESSTYQTT